ncbi:MAG: hypothetical protein INQ03_16060 [Candidatus Heimdallarchaeota archaeon]|nr:hypothetical protein [Candidatus Heimdallarchaeota archaeon]
MEDFKETAQKRLENARDTIIKIKSLKKADLNMDEEALLKNFRANLYEYSKLINQALEDNEVTPEELSEIQIREKKILQDARATILADGEVSKQEQELLEKLIDLFISMTDSN